MSIFSDIKKNSHKSSISNWIRNERNLGKRKKYNKKSKITLDGLYMGKKRKPTGLKSFSFTN